MSKIAKRAVSLILTLLILFAPVSNYAGVRAFAADFDDLNVDSVFLKQQTSITCTLASAAMMLRRTAICAGYPDWGEITEASIRSVAWIDGVGLRWDISCYGMTVAHGYFSGSDTKLDMIDLLEKYPQGIVIYNSGKGGQTHAVFLCDYDESTDTFYVADPTSTAPAGRIKLTDSTIVGETQDEQINNIAAYWYVSDPVVEYNNGTYSVAGGNSSSGSNSNNEYDPTNDVKTFESTMTKIGGYYVVTDTSSSGSALRSYPSGNSVAVDYVKQGTILYITHKGNNKFGATWYKTSDGNYIFSSNLTSFEDYSEEIRKFNSTAETNTGTYTVTSSSSDGAALRIEPSEGNNIIAYVAKGSNLYITESGVNSVGAKWYKTEDGYYIKASETEFKSADKLSSAGFEGKTSVISGLYSAAPVEDDENSAVYEPAVYKITASALNVRKSAVSGTVIGSLANGTLVDVLEVSGVWGKIDYNGTAGWICLDYAQRVDEASLPLEFSSIKLSENKIETGSSITCTVSMADNVKCMYTFSIYDINGEPVYASSYSQTKSSFTYTANDAGYYYFKIDAQDSLGRSVVGYSGNFVAFDKLQLDSVTCNVDSFTYAYETVSWIANASCVSDNAVYNYSLYCDGALVAETQSAIPEFSYTPEHSGSYILKVCISDEHSQTDIVSSDDVTVYSALAIDSINLSASSVLVGTSVNCAISASGGTGEYTYCFSVFNDGKLIKNGSFSKASEVLQTFSESGTYTFFCTVMDSGSMIVSSFSADIVVFDRMKGDANSDGKVTAQDARLVLRASAMLETLSESSRAAADVNNDGNVNAYDARCILRYAAKIQNSFD